MSLLSFTKKIVSRDQDETKKPTKKRAAVKKQEKAAPAATPVGIATSAGQIDLTPWVTEKAVSMQQANNTVVFRVRLHASKGQVAKAVLERYHIRPLKVRSMQMLPKTRRRGTSTGMTNAWKKVYVTLPAGKTIDVSV